MRRFIFLRKNDQTSEAGAALIAVMLTITLVTALFVMAFTNAMIGRLVANTHTAAKISSQCTQGAFTVANNILVSLANDGAINAIGGVTYPDLPRLLGEVTGGTNVASGLLANEDNPTNNPNIAIIAGNCTTLVDIDYIGPTNPDGESIASSSGYHKPVGGTACGDGYLYYITAVTTFGNATFQSQSVFFKC